MEEALLSIVLTEWARTEAPLRVTDRQRTLHPVPCTPQWEHKMQCTVRHPITPAEPTVATEVVQPPDPMVADPLQGNLQIGTKTIKTITRTTTNSEF